MVSSILLQITLLAALALGLSVANLAAPTEVGEQAYCPYCPPPCDPCDDDDDE